MQVHWSIKIHITQTVVSVVLVLPGGICLKFFFLAGLRSDLKVPEPFTSTDLLSIIVNVDVFKDIVEAYVHNSSGLEYLLYIPSLIFG